MSRRPSARCSWWPQPRLALLVVVLADGAVEKRSVELAEDSGAELLAAASAALAREVVGHLLSGAANFAPSGDQQLDRVLAAAGAALTEMAMGEENDQVFVGGPSRLAVAFDAVETVRSVLSILEQQLVVVSLLRDVLDRGLSVAIGTEHGFEPWRRARSSWRPSRSTASRRGHWAARPTRMNYPQALAAAHVVGERLGERIGDSLGRTSDAPASEPDRADLRGRTVSAVAGLTIW